ncbi:PDC sensor domain-containing protein [Campylobacter sp. RM9344]|uniref:PDC sensor domain-containing protein n=1 Tax=Campylobacter californiensis TaxID=1032243 RepID=A0AAW3ZW47_9BACT|nr:MULTISPECIES: PDC sensor domain-containing protein [unclassified Campylobacter]MBE3029733.1 PDC sensor domain-containing protein [Campylobacter sp. RM9344]MBE3606827.1 PDC sensor domain-containing protein [Campylobacter sp. RM13119]MBE3608663.1 PDC sensor domain-containing protein [Campylobacter sp. RM9337]
MVIKDIQRFSDIRYKARAYVCYLFNRNLPNHLPGVSLESLKNGLEEIAHEISNFDAYYILDENGTQIEDSVSINSDITASGASKSRINNAYYYRAVREKRFTLSDPYPSNLNGELCVTASAPIYNDKDELKFIACVDISLENLLKITDTGTLENYFGRFLKCIYTLFCAALFMICAFLFGYAVKSFVSKSIEHIDVSEIFESTIILTLALAIFDLVKTIFEEEVIGKSHSEDTLLYKTMVRFIGSIIIALAIEALMLVFKFAITSPESIINAIYLIGGVALLMIALSIYLLSVKRQRSQ